MKTQHSARVLAGASSKAQTQLTPGAAHVLLVQSRHVEMVMVPAQQAAMAVLHGLHAERDMGSIVEVGAAPVEPDAAQHLPAVLEMYPWLRRQRNYTAFYCIAHRPQNRSVRHRNYTMTSALMPSGAVSLL